MPGNERDGDIHEKAGDERPMLAQHPVNETKNRVAHAAKAGSFALADDVIEPLRPWIDRELRQFLQGGKRPMEEWMRQAVAVLQVEVSINRNKMRLLNAIDVYVQSFADAALARTTFPLKIPMLP